MTTRTIRSTAIALALTGSAMASAQVTKVGTGYLFRAKFTAGKTVSYQLNATLPMPGQPKPVKLTVPISQKTTQVKAGIASVVISIGQWTVSGQPMGEARSTPVRLDTMGKLVPGGGGSNQNLATFMSLPAKPIPVGGSWTTRQALGSLPGGPGGNVVMTCKLLGITVVSGKQVARLSLSVQNPGGRGIVGGGAGTIDVADGLLRTMALTITTPDLMAGSKGKPVPPVKLTVVLKRS